MGYGFIGYSNREEFKDGESIFYTSCSYAYEPIFKETFREEIHNFSGYVSKVKMIKFIDGVNKLKENKDKYNGIVKPMRGYLDNCSFESLLSDLEVLCELLQNKQVKYLNIA